MKTNNAVLYLDRTRTGNFLALQILSERGRSNHFYVSVDHLMSWLNAAGEQFVEFDGEDVIQLWHDGDNVRVKVMWLSVSMNDTITGHQDCFSLPKDCLINALNGSNVRKLVDLSGRKGQAKVQFSPSAQKLIGHLDQKHRRALSKYLVRAFGWGNETSVMVYSDFGCDFCFRELVTNGIDGGIIAGYSYVTGNDGNRHDRVVYSMHT